jgi:hypothetical protein
MQAFFPKPLKNIFVYPFKSPGAAGKLLIGTLLILANFIIPIIPGLFVSGYAAKIARQVLNSDGELTLPDWTDWGSLFKDGLRITVVGAIYCLPGALVLTVGFGLYFVSLFGLILQSSGGYEPGGYAVFYFVCISILMIALVVGMLFLFLAAVFSPAAIMHTIQKETISAGFKITEWWSILKKNLIGFLIAFIFVFGLAQIIFYAAYFLYWTMVACLILPLLYCFCSMYLSTVCMPLFAEAYKEGRPLNQQTEDSLSAQADTPAI